MKYIPIWIASVFLTTGANADSDHLVDQSKHSLPAHQLSFHDSMDVIVDPVNHNVCYVVRQSDSHSVSTFCLPQHQ